MLQHLLGYFIILLPFILLFCWIIYTDGLATALSVYGIVVGILAFVTMCVVVGTQFLK